MQVPILTSKYRLRLQLRLFSMYTQKSSEAVRIELRNTLQTRQNANSPSTQPNNQPGTQMSNGEIVSWQRIID